MAMGQQSACLSGWTGRQLCLLWNGCMVEEPADFYYCCRYFGCAFVLAGRNGRTYCNTICPVGTVLGFLSRYSLFRITIDSEKCNQCSLCSRNCKAACINFKEHQIDASRCVVCMNCIEKCKHGAISYKYHHSMELKTKERRTNTKCSHLQY